MAEPPYSERYISRNKEVFGMVSLLKIASLKKTGIFAAALRAKEFVSENANEAKEPEMQ